MRRALLGSVVLIFCLVPHLASAGPRVIQVEPSGSERPSAPTPAYENYRGYVFDLSENSERKDFAAIEDTLRRQLDVVENVEVPMLYAGVPAAQRRSRAEQLVESVGLTRRRSHRPGELSGGEMQRVAIARALANEPVLILADEPTGNLDTATAEVIAAMLDDLHRKGCTIVMVTHNPDLGKRTSRVVRIRDGVLQNEPG